MLPVAEIILASHEWFDGTGYPRGLSGEAIPVGSRIVSIADAFDVMTRRGIYAARLALSETLAELQSGAGTHFDPALIPTALTALGDAEHPAEPPGQQMIFSR